MHARLFIVGCYLALGGCTSNDSALQRSQEHLERGNYSQAYWVLAEQGVDVGELSDPAVRAIFVLSLLEQGREHVFNDRETSAIENFDKVLELDPDNAVAQQWRSKAHGKMATRDVRRGDTHRGAGELREALIAYNEALSHVQGFPPAMDGVEEVAAVVKRRQARAADHYTRGVAALGEQLYGLTWYHMVNAVEQDPQHTEAQARREDVGRRLLQERFARARELEDGGYFGAALKEYRDVEREDPEYEGLDERIANVEREVSVEQLVQRAEMAGFKNDLDGARQLLEQAIEMTTTQQADIAELLIVLKEQSLEDRYQKARILELERQFEAALAEYRAIDAQWEGFKDVKAQISNLESAIEVAQQAHEIGRAAEDRGDLAAAIDAYEEALLVYPGYQGLDARVKALRARQKAPQ